MLDIPEEICKTCSGRRLQIAWQGPTQETSELMIAPCFECSPVDCALIAMRGCSLCKQSGLTCEGEAACSCIYYRTGRLYPRKSELEAMSYEDLIEKFGDYRFSRLLKARTLDDLIEVADRLPKRSFEPGWFFNRHGDMIEALWSNEAYVAEWVNPKLTLLKSSENPEKIVGVHITKLGTTQKG